MSEAVQNIAVNLILAVGGLIASYALLYIKKAVEKVKTEQVAKLKDEKKQNLLKAALTQLDVLAENTVKAIELQAAGTLRQAVKDGKIDRQELLNLGQQAVAKICEQMQPEYLKVLEDNMANVEKYINDVVDANVLKAKNLSTSE